MNKTPTEPCVDIREPSANKYEASWAPADPRDKLYDDSATRTEKTGSVLRIVAAFHPVLNVPVLIYDTFQKFGFLRSVTLWGIIVAVLVGYAWFQVNLNN
ncbi:MAG: hypothetical protein AB3N28_10890 [Kordiimonas sp.]